jgi:hypothetical protein
MKIKRIGHRVEKGGVSYPLKVEKKKAKGQALA